MSIWMDGKTWLESLMRQLGEIMSPGNFKILRIVWRKSGYSLRN